MNKFHTSTIVVLIILATINITSATEIATLYTDGDIQGQSGQDINVKIVATGMNNVGTIAIALVFDNSVLSVNSVTDGNVKTPDSFSTSNVNNAQGLVAIGFGNPSGINGDGTIAVINFKVIGHVGDVSNLKLSLTANDIATNVIDTSTTSITNGKFTVIDTGGGLIEPSDNVLRYEIRERPVSAIPITFAYSISELAIYEIVMTSTGSGTALMRVDALKDTSKLVGRPAPGVVYKNINIWIDYKRVKNAIIRFKVDNSWIDNNGLSADNVKMSKWDSSNKKWIELLTNVINKDGNYTYFESQTESIPSSFVINGLKEGVAVVDTPQITVAIQPTVVATSEPQVDRFVIGMLIYPSTFKSGNYTDILNKLVNNNVTRIIVPVYDAKKGDSVHIFHAEPKGLDVSATNSFNLDKLLTDAHNRNIEVYVRITSFGPDPVVPTEEQKQNLKKVVGHILDNYADDKGKRIDGIYLDHIYYEEPLSAEGDTDIMANFVSDIHNITKDRAKLSASVKPAHYESLLHIYLYPYMWPISGPSDYYNVMKNKGQDYAKLSKNLDFISPIAYNEDPNYVGKATKFIKDKIGNSTYIIPNIQALNDTKITPDIQYAIESAKNNGANGVNIFDYSSLSDSEWSAINKI